MRSTSLGSCSTMRAGLVAALSLAAPAFARPVVSAREFTPATHSHNDDEPTPSLDAIEASMAGIEGTVLGRRRSKGALTGLDLEAQELDPGPVTVHTADEPGEDVLGAYEVIRSTADGRFGDISDPSAWEAGVYAEGAWRMGRSAHRWVSM